MKEESAIDLRETLLHGVVRGQRFTHLHKRANDKHADSRSPERSPASHAGCNRLSNGVPARRIHLHGPRAVKDVRRLERTVLGECIRRSTTPAPTCF